MSSSANPYSRNSSYSARRRSSSGRDLAATSALPSRNRNRIPAAADARPTSSTASNIACNSANARSRLFGSANIDFDSRKMIRAPTAVAPRSTETRNLGLDDRDAAAGFPLVEVVGGPEPGVARTDDRDVELGIAVERRARLDGLVEGREPEARGSKILRRHQKRA